MSLKRFKRISKEVFTSDLPTLNITRSKIAELKIIANTNPRKRVRVNAHQNINDSFHEMLIVHKKGFYCQPHKHLNKSDSLHMIEGHIKVIPFNDDGTIMEAFNMSCLRRT